MVPKSLAPSGLGSASPKNGMRFHQSTSARNGRHDNCRQACVINLDMSSSGLTNPCSSSFLFFNQYSQLSLPAMSHKGVSLTTPQNQNLGRTWAEARILASIAQMFNLA
eukprot:1149385-Pelagomonas_calceolata.AAC.2